MRPLRWPWQRRKRIIIPDRLDAQTSIQLLKHCILEPGYHGPEAVSSQEANAEIARAILNLHGWDVTIKSADAQP